MDFKRHSGTLGRVLALLGLLGMNAPLSRFSPDPFQSSSSQSGSSQPYLQTDPASKKLGPSDAILAKLPSAARNWVESLPWQHRRYVLSLCHLICAASAEAQAEFLDDYTADGVVSKKLEDQETRQRVKQYLCDFRIETQLSETVLRTYIRQFYIHSAQDTRRQPDLYLQSALKLVLSSEEGNHVFSYILGFELLKMMFQMSWDQHERLYRLQRNQEEFIQTFIKPIQHAHRINGIIVPKDADVFFARRSYFVQQPNIPDKKLIELVIATFTAERTAQFGFGVIRHPNSLCFDYDLIFAPEGDGLLL